MAKPRCVEASPLNKHHKQLGSRMPTHRYKYLRQSITLTGLGSPTFSSALSAVKTIHDRFDRQFEEHALQPWTENEMVDGISKSLDLSNRYLTPATDAGGMRDIPFLPGVDPRGILRSMAQGDGTQSYIHTEDNQVHYFSTCRDNEGARKCVKLTISQQMTRN